MDILDYVIVYGKDDRSSVIVTSYSEELGSCREFILRSQNSSIVHVRHKCWWLYVGCGAVQSETQYGLMQHSPSEIKEKLLKALDKEYNVRLLSKICNKSDTEIGKKSDASYESSKCTVKVACLSQLQVQVFHSIKLQVYPFLTKNPDLRHQKCAQIPLKPRIYTELVKKPVNLCVKIGLAELEEDVLPLAHLTYAAQRTRSVLFSRFRLSGDSCNIFLIYYFAIFFPEPAGVRK